MLSVCPARATRQELRAATTARFPRHRREESLIERCFGDSLVENSLRKNLEAQEGACGKFSFQFIEDLDLGSILSRVHSMRFAGALEARTLHLLNDPHNSNVISCIVSRNPRSWNSACAVSFGAAVHRITRGAPRSRSQSIATCMSFVAMPDRRASSATAMS